MGSILRSVVLFGPQKVFSTQQKVKIHIFTVLRPLCHKIFGPSFLLYLDDLPFIFFIFILFSSFGPVSSIILPRVTLDYYRLEGTSLTLQNRFLIKRRPTRKFT